MPRLTLANQRQRHVRQRREIAGCADRTLRRDQRQDIGVEQGEQGIDDLIADTRKADRKTVCLEQHDAPDDVIRQRLAGARAMTAHQVVLQRRGLLGGNFPVRERAKAGVDPITDFAAGEDFVDRCDAPGHALARRIGERACGCPRMKIGDLLQRQRPAIEYELSLRHRAYPFAACNWFTR